MDTDIFQSIKVDRIFEKVIKQIRQLIEDGVLKPGDKLPSERDLAEKLGCSRASVREAYRVLELEGVLVTKHGEGRYVQQVDNSLVMEYRFNPLDLIEKSALDYFFEARLALEPKIAELAALRATEEDIRRMEKIVNNLHILFKYPEEEISPQNSLILAMVEASRNFVFSSMVQSYMNMLNKVKKKSLLSERLEQRFEESYRDHLAILEAIKKRDPKAAAEAVIVHITNMKNHIEKELELEREQRRRPN